MLDNLMRLREPAAWVVIAVTAASIVLAVVRFALALPAGVPFTAAAQDVSLQAMNLSLVIVVVALVWACVFHSPTPGAPRIALAAAWVVTIGTTLTLVGAVAGLTASAGVLGVVLEFLGMALDIILKLVGTATLWLIVRGISAGRISSVRRAEAVPAAEPDAAVEPAGPPPVWRPDAASGAVWTSASDAASGAPASGHGVPGGGSGWHVVERPAGGTGVPGDRASEGAEGPVPAGTDADPATAGASWPRTEGDAVTGAEGWGVGGDDGPDPVTPRD